MNYFNEKTNDYFVKFFIDELYSVTEFVQHSDPNEEFDPEQEYGQHIIECQENLFLEIVAAINASSDNLHNDEIINIAEAKRKELWPVLNTKINEYIDKIKVDYK